MRREEAIAFCPGLEAELFGLQTRETDTLRSDLWWRRISTHLVYLETYFFWAIKGVLPNGYRFFWILNDHWK